MPIIKVTKPFMFSFPAVVGEKLTTERKFMPGDHEVPVEIAEHPWIKAGADGRVETAAQAQERIEYEARQATIRKADADAANAAAASAAARLKAAEPKTTATAKDLEEELNTPGPELRRRREQGQSAAGKSAA